MNKCVISHVDRIIFLGKTIIPSSVNTYRKTFVHLDGSITIVISIGRTTLFLLSSM